MTQRHCNTQVIHLEKEAGDVSCIICHVIFSIPSNLQSSGWDGVVNGMKHALVRLCRTAITTNRALLDILYTDMSVKTYLPIYYILIEDK